jgi:glycosyltransferase involved in cell wall biosynthesis
MRDEIFKKRKKAYKNLHVFASICNFILSHSSFWKIGAPTKPPTSTSKLLASSKNGPTAADVRRKLSIFLITYNEERRIGATLAAVQGLGDEIVIIDSGSTDKTVEIARTYGARVIQNAPFPGYGPQKRFAEDACAYDWVLNIDADEIVSPALRSEIRKVLKSPSDETNGFAIKIVDLLPGERTPGWLSYNVAPVRLYNKNFGRYSSSSVHDRVEFGSNASIKKLRNHIHHFSTETFGLQFEKLTRYSALQAEDFVNKHRSIATIRYVTEFPLSFFKCYLLRGYFLRGLKGFLSAMNYAAYRHIRVARIYDARTAKFAAQSKVNDIDTEFVRGTRHVLRNNTPNVLVIAQTEDRLEHLWDRLKSSDSIYNGYDHLSQIWSSVCYVEDLQDKPSDPVVLLCAIDSLFNPEKLINFLCLNSSRPIIITIEGRIQTDRTSCSSPSFSMHTPSDIFHMIYQKAEAGRSISLVEAIGYPASYSLIKSDLSLSVGGVENPASVIST